MIEIACVFFLLKVPPVISKDNIQGEGFAPKEVKIKVNNTLTLECEAQAIPVPTLHWYKDGQVKHTHTHTVTFSIITKLHVYCLTLRCLSVSLQILKTNGRITVTPSGRIVQIKQAQVSDTGRYTCVATNIAGEDEKDFDVNIQGEQGFTHFRFSHSNTLVH